MHNEKQLANPEQIHFVTGKLAEHALRRVLLQLAPAVGFEYTIQVLPITVAALMTPEWIARRLKIPPNTTRILLPGYCEGPIKPLTALTVLPIDRGPRDLHRLPDFFGHTGPQGQYGAHDIQIIAEINHAPQWSLDALLAEARKLKRQGADVVDVGCEPGGGWSGVGDAVAALVDAGLRVSIDSMDRDEIAAAVQAGAELVLSVNASNREAAVGWGCEVVAIPDEPHLTQGLDETIEFLAAAGVPLRVDPILEPIGCGFATSLGRYLEIRERYPDAEMMMGIGNLTELTDCDSAAINVLLLGFCQELNIRSVLTTSVINWARTSVQECDLARKLVHYAVRHSTPPKHIEPNLVLLRDDKVQDIDAAYPGGLSDSIRDHHIRVLADLEQIHLISSGIHEQGPDPFDVFTRFLKIYPRELDASHAFYLGYELAKAQTAMTLGKQYTQDEALNWGFLTREETSHRAPEANTNDDRHSSP